MAELRRHVASASPETPGRHTEYQALMQKLISAHQTALQSLHVSDFVLFFAVRFLH